MEEISIIHTPCKSCVFAAYSNKTQTGCHLDLLEKYKNHGVQILEAYDNELEFFILNKKKCFGYRENSWFITHGLSEDSTIEQKIQKFKESNNIGYLLVINFLETGDSDNDLYNLRKSLSGLKVQPKKLVFVRGSTGPDRTDYKGIQSLMKKTGISCPWRIQTMVDDSLSNEDILHNIINLDKSIRFICNIKKSDCANISTVIDKANRIVYDDLQTFVILSDKDRSCVLFSGGVYRYSLIEHRKDILLDSNNYIIV
jgi:hypothetical protein